MLTCHSWPKCGLSQSELRKYLFRIGIAMWNAKHSCRELCQNSKSQFISSFHMWKLLPILVSWYPNRDHNTWVSIRLKRSFYVSGRVPHIIPSQFLIQCTPFMVIQHTRKSICQYCEHFTTLCNLLQRVQKKSVDSPINHLFVRRLKQVIHIRRKRIFRRLGIPGNIFTLFNCLSISSLPISMFEGNV